MQSTVHGLTGKIQFDHEGARSDISVDVLELAYHGLEVVGHWNSLGFNVTREFPKVNNDENGNIKNKTFRVLIALVRMNDGEIWVWDSASCKAVWPVSQDYTLPNVSTIDNNALSTSRMFLLKINY